MHCSSQRLNTSIHQHLNGVNNHIQFTIEEKENGNLAFLNLLLKCVYRKKTHNVKYLDFASHHPLVHKQSVVTTFFEKPKRLSLDAVACAEKEVRIRSALKMDGYPKSFITDTAQKSSGKCQEKINEVKVRGNQKLP